MKPRKDLTGQTFGRLKVIKFDEEKYRIPYYDYDIINNIDDILKLQY